VVHDVLALGVRFLNGFSLCVLADDDHVGLDLAVRIEGSPLVAPNAVGQLDVFVQREFGMGHKNLLLFNTGKLTSWKLEIS